MLSSVDYGCTLADSDSGSEAHNYSEKMTNKWVFSEQWINLRACDYGLQGMRNNECI